MPGIDEDLKRIDELHHAGVVSEARYHVPRVLRREADGSWKVHRTIWNDAG
jgi:ketosteroid isomerase-like protein